MAFRWADNFTTYATAQIPRSGLYGNASASILVGGGRGGNDAITMTLNNAFWKILDNQATWIVGFAVQFTGIGSNRFVTLRDGTSDQVDIRTTAAGELQVTRNGTQLGITSGFDLALNTWYYIEFKATIHDTTGSFEVRVNGVTETALTASGVDTKNTANAFANRIQLWDNNTAGGVKFSDLYICDGTGSVNNTFIGDVKVIHLLVDGAGNYQQFTPSASTNPTNVDEGKVDDDTTYNHTATAANKDSYTFGNVGQTGSVKAVQLMAHIRKDDAGSRTARLLTRIAATDYFGPSESVLDSYHVISQIRETNPNTAVAWTVGGVDGAEFGLELVS